MADYNDGSSFGYDDISPYDYLPITFEESTLPSGREILTSHAEYPRFNAFRSPKQTNPIKDFGLSKKLETPKGMVEGFRSSASNKMVDLSLTKEDIHMMLLFMVIVIAVLQIKQMMAMHKMMRLHIMSMPVEKQHQLAMAQL